ncbi:MAG TPA: SDR family oxidoreductase [Dehalococcoidia bacterium]|nr:SDR family oxidoreductase [Dehalococcoidia bacterium]
MSERSFSGRVAVVVGGTRGIGLAVAERFASSGADVVAVYSRNAEAAEAARRAVASQGVRCEALKADIGDRDAIVALFREIGERFGRVDFLVNSAARGLERPRGALDSLPKHLRHTLEVNVLGPWFCAQEAARLMNGDGAIVNVLSPGAHRYLPRYAPVGVSKGALESLTRYLAVELAPRGIRVNGVSAGLVEGTDGVRMLPPALVEAYRSRIPAGRQVTPADVANAVAFLCSEDARMIIGQVLLVDGGYSLLGLV